MIKYAKKNISAVAHKEKAHARFSVQNEISLGTQSIKTKTCQRTEKINCLDVNIKGYHKTFHIFTGL